MPYHDPEVHLRRNELHDSFIMNLRTFKGDREDAAWGFIPGWIHSLVLDQLWTFQ